MSYLLRGHLGEWRAGLGLYTVTSRRFDFRYDLLQATAQRRFAARGFDLHPGLGLLGKGDFGGERLQNGFHRIRGLPEVHLSQGRPGAAVLALFDVDRAFPAVLAATDCATATIGLRLASGHVPSRLHAHASYRIAWRRVEGEALAGWRQYLWEVPQYSELVRSGPFGAANLRVRLLSELRLELGFSVLPVRNLRPDPSFAPKDPAFTPQLWWGFSWRGMERSVREVVDY